jgi:hypothetical protein
MIMIIVIETIMVMVIIIIIIIIIIATIVQALTIMYMKHANFLGHVKLQLFCGYNLRYLPEDVCSAQNGCYL